MSILLEKLENYGADVNGAMSRFLKDEELYAVCLSAFESDEGFAELGEALKNQDYQQAFDAAHTIKGVAGNLGLTPLFEAI